MGKSTTASKNKYNAKAYDRIIVIVPKGKKELYQEVAKAKGYRSLNNYINQLIEEDIKNSPAE